MRTTLFGLLVLTAFTASSCTRPEPTASQPPTAESVAPATPAAGSPAAVSPTQTPAATTPDAESSPAASTTPAGAGASRPLAPETPTTPAPPRFREVIVPAGTELLLKLDTALASDTSKVEDPVRASVRRALVIHDLTVLPAGTGVTGVVTGAERSGKVKGRASLAFRFTSLVVDAERYDIRTATLARVAAGTKKKDATKIGIGAGAGAILGGIVGGGKGAAVGTAVGGGAGTGVVLATRGQEVRLAAGTPVTVKLTSPLSVRVPLGR